MLILSTYWYLGERNIVERDFSDLHGMPNEMLRQSVIFIDRGIVLYEMSFEPDIREAMQILSSAYNKTNGDITILNLSELKSQFSRDYQGEWDLYIIDNGVITRTTFPGELNLDFKKYPEFYNQIKDYVKSDDLIIDRTVSGFDPDSPLRKFAYQGSPDHRYIFEISRNFKKFRPDENKNSYHELINTTSRLNPNIMSIDLFNFQGIRVATISTREKVIPGEPKITSQVSKTYSSKTSYFEENQSQQVIVEYSFLPVEENRAPSTSSMHLVARIVYSKERQNEQYLRLTFIYLSFVVITVLIGFLIAFAVSRHLTRPLNQIGEDVDKIASGDLDHQMTLTGAIETERIENSIALMVQNLKEKIESLRIHEEQLRQELDLRKKAEEKYRRLFDSSHEAIFILEKGIIRDCNQEACIFLKMEREQIIGKKISDFSPEQEQFNLTGTGEVTFCCEWKFIRSDGVLVETQVHLNTITVNDSVLIQEMVRDVTELNEMYRREIRAISKIEEILCQLAAINDQIRNPLAIISTLAEMDEGKYEKQIQEQVDRINTMIDEVDRGFIATDKVRTYLRKHYEIGEN
jgi:PAS domain S-box-containing protein